MSAQPDLGGWEPVDLVALGALPPEPPTIGGLVYPGRRHLLSGEPESLKSWLALCLCTAEIRDGRTVVWLDFETTPRETLARLRDLGLTDSEIADQFVYLGPGVPLAGRVLLAALDALLLSRRPSLVVVDAMTGALTLHGLDPNSGRDIESFYSTIINRLRAHGAAVLVVDHVVKNRDARGKWATGSERKSGAADVHLGIEIIHPFGRGRKGLAKILTHKDRAGHIPRPRAAEFEIESHPDSGHITWTLRPAEAEQEAETGFRPTFLMQRTSQHLEGQHEPVSRNAVETAVEGKREYVRVALNVLVAEGYVTEESGARNARLFRSIRPYREADELAEELAASSSGGSS